jgi:hypothetical protein
VGRSVDGFTVGTPTAVAMDGRDAMLAVAMNGEPLPIVHGFPVRMIVPGLYGYVSATKWVVDLELTTFDAYDPYWVERGWAERAPIKTMSRIDTPQSNQLQPARSRSPASRAQDVGIDGVDVAIDDGPGCRRSSLRRTPSIRGWVYGWRQHTASTAAGSGGRSHRRSQTRCVPTHLDATGYHTIAVTVRRAIDAGGVISPRSTCGTPIEENHQARSERDHASEHLGDRARDRHLAHRLERPPEMRRPVAPPRTRR